MATGVLIPTRRRRRKDRYRDSHQDELATLRTRLGGVIREGQREEPPVVALAVLAQMLGVLSSKASAAEDDVVYQAGHLTWLLVAVRDFGNERLNYLEFKSRLGFGSSGI